MDTQQVYTMLKTKLAQTDTQDDALNLIADYAKKATQAERCSIFIYHKNTDQLKSIYADGLDGNIFLKSNVGIAGYAFHKKTTILENDTLNSPIFFKSVDTKTHYKTENILAVPLIKDTNRIGVIELLNKKDAFNEEDKNNIESLAILLIDIVSPTLTYLSDRKKQIQEKTLQEKFDTFLDSRRLYLMEDGSAYYKIIGMRREYFIAADQCYQLEEKDKKIDIYYYTINQEFFSIPMSIKLDKNAQNLLIIENSTKKSFTSYALEEDDLDLS